MKKMRASNPSSTQIKDGAMPTEGLLQKLGTPEGNLLVIMWHFGK